MASQRHKLPAGGLPLQDAARALAPRRLRHQEKHVELKPLRRVEATADPETGFKEFADLAGSMLDNARARAEPVWEMQAALLEDIKRGRYVITGVRTRPAGDGSIEVVAPHFFDGKPKIDWTKSALENYGLRFERVRVCGDVGDAQSKNVVLKPPAGSPKVIRPANEKGGVPGNRGGRPDTKPLLREILSDLMLSGQFMRAQRKAQFAQFRQEARAKHPYVFKSASQPSEDTMWAVMTDLGLTKSIT